MKFIKTFIFLAALVFLSCKGDTAKIESSETVAVESSTGDYTLTPFDPSQEFEDATINGFSYKGGGFNFDVGGESYVLGNQTEDAGTKMCANSGKGQHIHVLLDDKPYSAQYTSNFDFQISDGQHTLLSFLSRSYHESIKTDKAHVAKNIVVKEGNITSSTDISEPTIWHSRPKGTYVGKDTERVMLDFYLKNVDLGNGNNVKVTIDGVSQMVDVWQPYYITGLAMGEHQIELSIQDSHGHMAHGTKGVKGSFTLVSDEILVQ